VFFKVYFSKHWYDQLDDAIDARESQYLSGFTAVGPPAETGRKERKSYLYIRVFLPFTEKWTQAERPV
jgi:hypothetical protein